MKKRIAILLPYKEKYTSDEAAAASIWVKDYLNLSKLKKETLVFGDLAKNKKPITNNFINLDISKINTMLKIKPYTISQSLDDYASN